MTRKNVSAIPNAPDIETATEQYMSRFSGPVGKWLLSLQATGTRKLLPATRSKVLDVGGGHGQNIGVITADGHPLTVLGSEGSSSSLIRPFIDSGDVTFQVGSLIDIPFPFSVPRTTPSGLVCFVAVEVKPRRALWELLPSLIFSALSSRSARPTGFSEGLRVVTVVAAVARNFEASSVFRSGVGGVSAGSDVRVVCSNAITTRDIIAKSINRIPAETTGVDFASGNTDQSNCGGRASPERVGPRSCVRIFFLNALSVRSVFTSYFIFFRNELFQ